MSPLFPTFAALSELHWGHTLGNPHGGRLHGTLHLHMEMVPEDGQLIADNRGEDNNAGACDCSARLPWYGS